MSVEPGRPVAALPIDGTFAVALLPPPENATASPMPTATSTTTPAAIASTRGLACLRRTPPFETTGGGAETAARRACFDFLPLGIGRNSSGVLVGAGGRE